MFIMELDCISGTPTLVINYASNNILDPFFEIANMIVLQIMCRNMPKKSVSLAFI